MRIQRFYRGGWPANCYLTDDGHDAVLIDPSAEAADVTAFLQRNELTLRAILLTHGHFDHILSLDALRAPAVPVCLHCADADFLGDPDKSCYRTLLGIDARHAPADILLSGGETLHFGGMRFTVLHTPGHTSGSVCYRTENALFSGDTIFAEGVGRTDLPGGSLTAQAETLAMLRTLLDGAPSLTVYPGHGPSAALAAALNTL